MGVCLATQGTERRKGYNEVQGDFQGAVNMLIISIMVLMSWVQTHVKTYQVVHFKYGLCITCQLHLSNNIK